MVFKTRLEEGITEVRQTKQNISSMKILLTLKGCFGLGRALAGASILWYWERLPWTNSILLSSLQITLPKSSRVSIWFKHQLYLFGLLTSLEVIAYTYI